MDKNKKIMVGVGVSITVVSIIIAIYFLLIGANSNTPNIISNQDKEIINDRDTTNITDDELFAEIEQNIDIENMGDQLLLDNMMDDILSNIGLDEDQMEKDTSEILIDNLDLSTLSDEELQLVNMLDTISDSSDDVSNEPTQEILYGDKITPYITIDSNGKMTISDDLTNNSNSLNDKALEIFSINKENKIYELISDNLTTGINNYEGQSILFNSFELKIDNSYKIIEVKRNGEIIENVPFLGESIFEISNLY